MQLLNNTTTYYWGVQVSNTSGNSDWSQPRCFASSSLSSIEDILPAKTKHLPNYPNPFNPSTQIRFSLAESSLTKLDVYSIDGTKVACLVNEVLTAG